MNKIVPKMDYITGNVIKIFARENLKVKMVDVYLWNQ